MPFMFSVPTFLALLTARALLSWLPPERAVLVSVVTGRGEDAPSLGSGLSQCVCRGVGGLVCIIDKALRASLIRDGCFVNEGVM